MSDGPHGLRKQGSGMGTDMLGINESEPATCFPAEVTTGASWDTEILEKIGAAFCLQHILSLLHGEVCSAVGNWRLRSRLEGG